MVMVFVTALGPITVDAGPDQVVSFPDAVQLAGVVEGLSPIDFWLADGNNATEDKIVQYHSVSGLSSLGPLRTSSNQIYGWPSDLTRIGGTVYGIETFLAKLYTLNESNGIVTPIGSGLPYGRMSGLAYDATHDLLYCNDYWSDALFTIDRVSGAASHVMYFPSPYFEVHGLAYDGSSGLIYACDEWSQTLLTVNPTTHQTVAVASMPHDPVYIYDELDFYRGKLYTVVWHQFTGVAQVRRIDLPSGAMTDIGPPIADVSAHSLMINSLPEATLWSKETGPGDVTFGNAALSSTTATFSEPGVYVLRLTVLAEPEPITDTVQIESRYDDCNHNSVADPLDIDTLTSSDINSNRVPDECECLTLLGDLNGSNTVDVDDVPAFVDVVLDQDVNQCADMNEDGVVDGRDAAPFVAAVLGP